MSVIFDIVIELMGVGIFVAIILSIKKSLDKKNNPNQTKNKKSYTSHSSVHKKPFTERINDKFKDLNEQIEKTKQANRPSTSGYRDYSEEKNYSSEQTSFDSFQTFKVSEPKVAEPIVEENISEPNVQPFEPMMQPIIKSTISLFDDIEPAEAAEMAIEAEPAKAFDEF